MKSNYKSFLSTAQFLKLFAIAAFAFLLGTERSHASHAAGANLTYCHGVGNNYTINYTLYRDCIGIPAPATVTVTISSISCGLSFTQTLTQVPGTGQEITVPCPGTLTTCQGGTEPGIQKWEYEATIQLPAQCTDWNISYAECCRNAAITTLQNPGGENLYVEAQLDNSSIDNCSPQFSNDPIVFVCIGQQFIFNNGAIDPDGDSLAYSFITPRTDANLDVVYAPGYSLTNPISSNPAISIDPVTGDIIFNATATEVGVIAVLIMEYRNGVLIGTVMRDIQIYTVPCNNALPTLTGIDSTTVYAMNACAGSNICFDIFSNDLDAGQTLTMTWNNGIPQGSLTIDSTLQFPTATFCWATQASDASTQPYIFTVTIRDDNCPSTGAQIYSYSITLSALTATATSTPASCNGSSNGTATVNVTGGSAPYEYLWSPGQHVGQTATGLSANTYTVYVFDSSGCQATQTVVVTEPPLLQTTISNLIDASCGVNGGFDITASGGTPNYTYYTNTVPPTVGTNVVAPAGNYTVTVRDANNCRSLTQVTIGSSGSLQATETHTDVSCNGANDGTANISLVGAQGNEVFVWTPSVSNDSIASGLGAGSYVVDISNGTCSTQIVINISEPAAITATETHTDVTCNGAADGSVTINASGGTGLLTYAWTPNVSTGSSATGLGGGTYCVDITDANQCTINICATVAEASPLVLTTSSSPASCLLTNGSATVVATGGAGGYSYSWSNGETTSTISNLGTGSYDVDVMDSAGCIASATVIVSSTGVNAVVSAQTDATCENGDDGSATVTASGGQAPYTYSWSPVGGNAATATGLSPGVYTVTVTDYLGCAVIVTVNIGFINPAPAVELGPDTTLCIGATITLDAGAGLTYLWNDNSTNQTLDVTASGTYGVVVTDANGCQNSDMITVTFVTCNAPMMGHSTGRQFEVYPNPATNLLNIVISNVKNENVKVELSDILGNRVYSSNEQSTIGYKSAISLDAIPSGVYLLKVQYSGEVRTIKIVKN